jgi:fatty acid desaturase
MTEEFTAKQRVRKREQYSKWINRSVGAGVASFFIATVVWTVTDRQLVLFVGLGLYWLGALGMGIGYWYSPVSLRDEFEQQMEWEANQAVSAFIAAATIIGIPADVVLSVTGVYTAPAVVRGAIWGYLLLVFIFGAAHWYVKRQYE